MDVSGLDALVEGCDWQRLNDVLTTLSDPDRADAARWYRRSGRAHARRVADRDWRDHSRVVQLLLALTLAEAPEEASKNCQWGRRFLWRDDDLAVSTCAAALMGRGREWAAEFVRLASAAHFRGEAQRGVGEVVALVSAAIAAYDLPVPLTETYIRGWALLITWAHTYAKAENRGDWHPLVVMTAGSGSASPAYNLSARLTLRECLIGTRSPTELLVAAVATPNALLDWAGFREDAWAVAPAIRYAVSTGLFDRQPLLDGTFSALSRDDRANNQRVLAELLKGLDPTSGEIKDQAPLILHVLPTAHGSVTKTLLELALAADLTEEDLVELGAVILARPEKAQKVTLLAHLAAVDSPAREPLLTMAMDSDDAALAAKARALLRPADSGGSSVPTQSTAGLPPWSHHVEPFQPGLFTPYAANEAALDEARSDEETWSRITTEAAYLDLVVRFAHRDLHRLREVVSRAPDPNWYSHVRTPFLLHQWVKTGKETRSYQRTSTTHRFSGDASAPIIETHTFEMRPPAHLLFTDRLIEETLPRLGALAELLSTPSRWDGTLDVQVLAQRVQAAGTAGYGPYDLVQALLRLGPTTPSDIRLFDDLALPPVGAPAARRSWLMRRTAVRDDRDGVEVIRNWITSGGWSPRNVDFPALKPRTSALTLPLPDWLADLDGLAGICTAVGSETETPRPWGSDDPGPWLGVCPWDVENLATRITTRGDQDSVFHAQRLPLLVSSAGPMGPAVHHHLARLLVHPRLDSRLLAAQHASTLARQGRLDPHLLDERSQALFAQGELSLTRAAHGWAALASMSSMDTVWPAWSSLLDLACGAAKTPAGLSDLLRATREHAPSVSTALGQDWLPASVRRLAEKRGSTKAATEARALVSTWHTGGF